MRLSMVSSTDKLHQSGPKHARLNPPQHGKVLSLACGSQ